MAVTSDRIRLKRGETQTVSVTFITAASYYDNENKPSAWIPIDISNCTVRLMVKLSINDNDSQATINKTNGTVENPHSDPTNGKTTFQLSSTDTLKFPTASRNCTYSWEAWLISSTGSRKATRVGSFEVLASVIQNPT